MLADRVRVQSKRNTTQRARRSRTILRQIPKRRITRAIGECSASIEKVDRLISNVIDIDSKLPRVPPGRIGKRVGPLKTLLVRPGRPGKKLRHSEADSARNGCSRIYGVRDLGFKISPELELRF